MILSKPSNESLGTQVDKNFIDQLYAPSTKWPKIDMNFKALPKEYDFDLDQARSEIFKIRNSFEIKPFRVSSKDGRIRDRKTYRGLGLTTRPESGDPLYDALSLYGQDQSPLDIYNTFRNYSEKLKGHERNLPFLDESHFSETTEACSPFFKNVLSRFKSAFTKVRLLEMMPNAFIPPHVDFPYYEAIRVHSVIETNEDVVWEVDGEQFKIPADGKFYWFDTGKYHAVINRGKTPRLVLSVNLMVYKNRDQKQIYGPQDNLIQLINEGMI